MNPLPPILPVGTAVVRLRDVRAGDALATVTVGSGGLIVKAPVDGTHAYRVRMTGG